MKEYQLNDSWNRQDRSSLATTAATSSPGYSQGSGVDLYPPGVLLRCGTLPPFIRDYLIILGQWKHSPFRCTDN